MADTDEMNTQATETMEQPEEEICQENLPVATSGSTDMEDEEEPYLASDMYQRLVALINNFESTLPDDMQAGGRLVSSGNITFSIQDVGFWDPNMIVFYGELSDGSRVELVQHLSQLDLLLVAVPRKDPSQPRRVIGFETKNEAEPDKIIK